MASLMHMDRLFVNQKAKLFELTNEYKIFDEQGAQVGVIRQEGQTGWNKLARLTVFGALGRKTLAVYEADGTKLLQMVKPRAMRKPKIEITDGVGNPVGTIATQNWKGRKMRFSLEGGQGEALGELVGTRKIAKLGALDP